MATITKVQKWGNSLGVRIPKETATKLALVHGSAVQIEEKPSGVITLAPVKKMMGTIPKYSLAELMRGVTPGDLTIDRAWLDMEPVGKEVLEPWDEK